MNSVMECFACGYTTTRSSHCNVCGYPLALPPPVDPASVGQIVRDRGLRRRQGMIVGVEDGVMALDSNGRLFSSKQHVDRPRSPDEFRSVSRAGRILEATCQAPVQGNFQWVTALMGYAVQSVGSDLGQSRWLAADAMRLGIAHRVVPLLALPPTEKAVLLGDAAALSENWLGCAHHYSSLAPGSFQTRIPTAVQALSRLPPDAPDRQQGVAWLTRFGQTPLAVIALTVLGAPPQDYQVLAWALRQRADLTSQRAANALDDLLAGGSAVGSEDLAPSLAWLKLLNAGPEAQPAISVTPATSLNLVDDLCDFGFSLNAGSVFDDSSFYLDAYVTARTRPEALTGEQVRRLGWETEITRRTVGRGERVARRGTPLREFTRLARKFLDGEDSALDEIAQVWGTHEATELSTARGLVASAYPGLPRESEMIASRQVGAAIFHRFASKEPSVAPSPGLQTAVHCAILLRQARDAAHRRDWPTCLESSQQAFRSAQASIQQAESLNLIALAQHSQGREAEAGSTLERALSLVPATSLAVNTAAVSASQNPSRAIAVLCAAASRSTLPRFRYNAIMAAVALHSAAVGPTLAYGLAPPSAPATLRQGIRTLLLLEDLNDAEVTKVLELLAELDGPWLTSAGPGDVGKWADSAQLRVAKARATGPRETVQTISELLRNSPDDPYLQKERDRFVSMLKEALAFEDDALGAGLAMWEAVDDGLAIGPDDQIPLVAAACGAVARHVISQLVADRDSDIEYPTSRIDLMVWAISNYRSVSADDRDAVRDLCVASADCVQHAVLLSMFHLLVAIAEHLESFAPAFQYEAATRLRPMLLEMRRDVLKLRPYVSAETISATDDFLVTLGQL